MPPRLRGKNITYRELPPRIRQVYPEGSDLPPAQRYLRQLDRDFSYRSDASHGTIPTAEADDLVHHVFSHQIHQHRTHAYQLARQVVERQQVAKHHRRDLRWRLEELRKRKPLRLTGPGAHDDGQLTEVEKQILDLERQERQIERDLWRDLLETRRSLAEARREYHATRARMRYLDPAGGGDGEF